MYLWGRLRSIRLPSDAERGLCAILLPTRPRLFANCRKIPAACPRSVRIKKSHPQWNLQSPRSLYPDRADAFSVPCASSHGRPWSLDHRRSAPLWRLCARTEPLFHELRRASAHYFRFWTFPHYTLGLSSRQKRVFGNSYCENHISKSLTYGRGYLRTNS